MTDILCKWLNDELDITQQVDQVNFAREFASGYLIGEVLNKYQLQSDFDQFSQSKTADSKLNNFTRIEPVLHLLGIPFDTNVARDVMTEKHGVATRLMYQLYVALNNKKKANLTGVAMETMRPAAPAKLNAVETGIYKERLKHATPRQTDLNLEALVQTFHEKQIEMEKVAFADRFREQERIKQQQQDQRRALLARSQRLREKQSEIVAKIQAATVNIPKPPPEQTAKAIQRRREIRRRREASETVDAISQFEDKMKMILPPSKDDDGEVIDVQYILTRDEDRLMDAIELIKPASNDDYIGKIRKRLHEDESARAEREKRRRKVLVDQMKAHESQEEARREEMLVNRLMRQSQQERRIAVQLLQARHEKEIIRKNRIIREKQYEERRLKDFEDALNRESEMARLAKLEYEEQTKKDQELHDKIAAERAEARYTKHYESCNEVVNQLVDFACKVAEYRELTEKLVPAKLMREWKSLFIAGKPLYEQAPPPESTEPSPEQILEEERQALLDEGDFGEYKTMTGEWQPPDSGEVTQPPRDNPITGHVIQRLFNMVSPPTPPPPPPEFPAFPIRACVLGKVFSGKSTVVQQLAKEHRLQVLDVDTLVSEAVQAHENGETMAVQEPEVEEIKDAAPSDQALQPAGITINIRAPTGEGSITLPETDVAPPSDNQTEEVPKTDPDPTAPPATEQPQPQELPPPSPLKRTKSKLSKEKKLVPDEPEPTPKAKLGAKALKYLKKGQAIDDQVIVDILIETIRWIPEETGWVIDGFPTNLYQAKVLEKALTGFAAGDKKGDKSTAKMKKSNLVKDPRPTPPAPEPASGLDVVINFEVPDDLCLKRSAGRLYGMQANEQYHQEFKPPPEGSMTGVGKQEQVVPIQDMSHDQDQIQQRITRHLDSWPKIEKWYNKFGVLAHVDASQGARSVYLEVEKILEDTLAKLQGIGVEPEPVPEPVEEKKEEPPAPPPEPPKEEPPPEEKTSRSSSRKGSGKKSRPSSSRSKSPKDKKGRDKSSSPKRSANSKKSEAGSKKGSRGSSPKSKKGSGKKGKTPEPEPEPEPQEPTGPPPPEPGSEEWEFVNLPLEKELAEVLAKYWENVEKTYVGNSKHVFRKLREERENIYRYFFQIKKDYLAYLRRPDNKEVYVNQWQKEYNDVPDDMREDEETKAELHQRVDDLRVKLWDICDERKAQAEKERQAIMDDGWLDDRLGLLSNFYLTQMQGEVDRYQDTVRMLKDYYKGMDGHYPEELNTNFSRIPLIELPVERAESPDKSESETASNPPPAEERRDSAKSDRPKSGRSKSGRSKSPKSPKERKSRTPSAKKRDKSKEKKEASDQTPADETGKKKIPLVPRRPVSPDPDSKAAGAGKDKKDKKPGKKDDGGTESPAPPMDPDEKLLFDGFLSGSNALATILQGEHAAREAEEEADRRREEEQEREKAAAAQKAAAGNKKGGKKGKSRSPSPKKKKDDSASTPTPVSSEELSEEDKQKKEQRERMRQEFYFAIQEEETAAKKRLELIKSHGIGVLQDLKSKADNSYKEMNDWLGARFLKEMESIDQMSEAIRYAIEKRQKLKEELVLQQEDFLINTELKVLRSPSPAPPPVIQEVVMPEHFTVSQLLNLYQQFTATGPTGVMSKQSFVETFENMVSVAFGMEQLPDIWMNISPQQVQEIANGLSANVEYVDWRRFLIAIAQPLPSPTQTELLETLQKFKTMDQKSTGFVTREQYDRMDIWFGSQSMKDEEFDRSAKLKAALFDFFADHSKTPPVMNYVSMLMYFSASPNASEGFLRALSVTSGTHMPRLPRPELRAPSRSDSNPDIVEDHSPSPPTPVDIPDDAINAKVPLEALYQVLHHGENASGDSHRFSVSADPEDATSMEKLSSVYQELGSENLEPLCYKVLVEHPLIQDVMTACQTFKSLDIRGILNNPAHDVDLHSTKTLE
ncbi:sperm flagellar protein 2-like isoform X3 [Ostrea edulis]|uniref:sperm flagellar protein 2-like isoform X3 n=1 Tax=Ostrea edulis TaxID=37623 RepID=UPI0024AF1720|nr:sperm flagellar protein 2-like isoform X3 [Ostrea edulis]